LPIRSQLVAIGALLFGSVLAYAHEDVTRHHPHSADSHKPHEANSRKPHTVSSHAKPQKPPKHETAHSGARPHSVAKH
jgi:hypothetical protein